MTDDMDRAVKAIEAARNRLGATKGRARPAYRAELDARGSAAQASLASVRSSHDSLGSILKRWESALPTIGEQLQAAEASSSTGPQRGETGVVVSLHQRACAKRQSAKPTVMHSPLTHVEIAELLIELSLMVKMPRETQEERRIRFNSYRDRLAALPGEAVRKALKGWPDSNEFWPSWAELKREIVDWA